MDQTVIEEGKEYFQVAGCQRVLRLDSKSFSSEKDILKALRDKENGSLKGNQTELTENPLEPYISISGRFKNGKREGTWILKEPVELINANSQPKQKY